MRFHCFTALVLSASFAFAGTASAQQTPADAGPAAAIGADPPVDKAHPAAMESFQIPSHGAALNAILYEAAGAGPHPLVIVLHGFPGNEKNLDLAQAIRRSGWNAAFFDYRGSWGSPGGFSFGHSIEDTQAAIAYFRDPAVAAKLRIDPKRIALVGHSMGGFMAAYAGSHDPAILGIGMISAANLSDWAARGAGIPPGQPMDEKTNVRSLAANLEAEDILPLAGCTGESLAREMLGHRKEWNFLDYAALFGTRSVLLLSSDDGLAPQAAQLAAALRKQGSTRVTEKHLSTDHSYSDQRIALETSVLAWLATLP